MFYFFADFLKLDMSQLCKDLQVLVKMSLRQEYIFACSDMNGRKDVVGCGNNFFHVDMENDA